MSTLSISVDHPSIGRASAIRFSKTYPVALLSRSSQSYEATVKEINDAGGKAIGINADTTSIESLNEAFETIRKELPDHKLAAAIYNANTALAPKPFIEVKPEELEASIDGNMYARIYQSSTELLVMTNSK